VFCFEINHPIDIELLRVMHISLACATMKQFENLGGARLGGSKGEGAEPSGGPPTS
jgi:hypothetical protein